MQVGQKGERDCTARSDAHTVLASCSGEQELLWAPYVNLNKEML